MQVVMILIGVLGGLGLFLYGMSMASDALQKYSANRIKEIFASLTRTPAKGVLVGMVITFLLQGSSAATVLIVGFVSAGLMTFTKAWGVIMGSAIGTTFTVQLIAFRITDYALLLVAIGAGLAIFTSKRKSRYIGQIILGFGLLFYGMGVMTDAMGPLKDNHVFTELMANLANKPFLLLLLSTLFTAVVQSSAATLALAMTLAMEGVFSIDATIPIMFGANVGTTATALLSSLASTREAKRVALANLMFKVFGVAIIYPFITPLAELVLVTSQDISRQIANAHTLFNIAITMIFFPLINWLSLLIYKFIPEKQEELEDRGKVTKFIDENMLNVPDIALWQAKNEIHEMGKMVGEDMLLKVPTFVKYPNERYLYELARRESRIDRLYVEISKFITALSERDLQEEQSQDQVKYLYLINDLEHIGDIVLSIGNGYQKAVDEELVFSKEDIEDFETMYDQVKQNYDKALNAFYLNSHTLAADVIKSQPEMTRLEKDLRFNHFSRMAAGERKNIDSSSSYLNMVNDLLRIHSHIVSISQTVIGIV